MINMAKVIDVRALADKLELELYDPIWFRYSLGRGFGTRDSRKDTHNRYKQLSAKSTTNKDMYVNQVILAAEKMKFHNTAGFYPGVLIFVLGDYQDMITWVEGTDFKHIKLNNCVQNLTFPVELKEKMEKMWDSDIDFEYFLDEIEAFGDYEINFESVREVYQLQGKKAIFGILAQIFGNYAHSEYYSCHLIPNLDIIWTPKVENLVSGCIFPVCVSPFVDNFKVSRTKNGAILQAFWHEKWWDFDIFEVGQFNLWRETLNQRRNYLRNEAVLPCLVCDNWLEVVEACNYFGEDVIIREFERDLLNGRWFRFGKGGHIAVRFEGRRISVSHKQKTIDGIKIDDNHGVDYGIMTLDGHFVKQASKKDVVYTFDELSDWFELGSMCNY